MLKVIRLEAKGQKWKQRRLNNAEYAGEAGPCAILYNCGKCKHAQTKEFVWFCVEESPPGQEGRQEDDRDVCANCGNKFEAYECVITMHHTDKALESRVSCATLPQDVAVRSITYALTLANSVHFPKERNRVFLGVEENMRDRLREEVEDG